jgi:hypothetical protein
MKTLFWAVMCLGSLAGTAYAGHSVSGERTLRRITPPTLEKEAALALRALA